MVLKAEYIRDLDGFTGTAKLWRVPKGPHSYVVTSATFALFGGPETYVFPADEKGNVLSWSELPGSFRGDEDHDTAINGYLQEQGGDQ